MRRGPLDEFEGLWISTSFVQLLRILVDRQVLQ
jgi:hypothetical protein